MPSSTSKLDLEAWADLIPNERNNDYEYNLLVYRFKTFYDEVKEFHALHTDCSNAHMYSISNKLKTDNNTIESRASTGVSIRNNLGVIGKTSNSHDHSIDHISNRSLHVVNLRKKFSQDQETSVSQPFKGNTSLQYRFQSPTINSQDSSNKQFNSNINLNSTDIRIGSVNRQGKQQIIQPSLNSQSTISKSNERLDNLNNNVPAGSSFENELSSASFPISNHPFRSTLSRISKLEHDDENIYDAVPTDDQFIRPTKVQTLVQSMQHNLNEPNSRKGLDLIVTKSSPMGNTSRVNLVSNRSNLITAPSLMKQESLDEAKIRCEQAEYLSNPQNALDTSSSLSLLPNFDNLEYGNYVNIDFFLKRGIKSTPKKTQGPPFHEIEEDDSSDDSTDQNPTQLSTSLSNDKLCDESLKDLSPRELARKLASNSEQNDSPESLTPASSSDFLDDPKSTISFQLSTTSSFSKRLSANDTNNSSLSYNGLREEITLAEHSKSSTAPRESTSSRLSSSQQQKVLEMIKENQLNYGEQATSRESSQLFSDNNSSFAEAHSSMRSFLSDLNLSHAGDVFEDKAQRRIVKESFAVEFCNRRKLRHLFLFNDVIVCAKYQASSKQKFTFDVKWYLDLNGVSVSDVHDSSNQAKLDRETIENQILAIRTNLMLLRSRMQQIKRSKDKRPSRIIKKLKKKRTELEAELVLLLPHLPLVIKHVNGKKYLFFLSSNFDRNQWIESIKYLQSQLSPAKSAHSSPSSSELQAWIQTCRKNLNPSLGTFLLRSNCDDDLLHGDLYVKLSSIKGLPKPGHYYFCFEIDSYGHFSQKASSVVLSIQDVEHVLNEEYTLPLDGAHTLRILLYEDLGQNFKPSVIGKAHVELSRSWFFDKPIDRVLEFNSSCRATIQLSFSNLELLSTRMQHAKLCPTFGIDITQVSKREKTNVPMLIQMCVNEVERRGMREVGIYRMSGTSTDIQRLKKAFEANPYVAELLLRDIDINSVTGFLKTYLREMPEGLFINKLYLKFVAAFSIPQSNSIEKTSKMLELFHKIPIANQHTIIYLVEHLVKVNKYESYNKMSLTNLATVLGPNILRPPSDASTADSSDPFTAVFIGSMSQAGILYFFLNRKASNLPLMELDSSELGQSGAGTSES